MIAEEIKKAHYRPAEYAEYWDISRRTVYRLIERGKIAVVKIGRQYRIPRREYIKNGLEK